MVRRQLHTMVLLYSYCTIYPESVFDLESRTRQFAEDGRHPEDVLKGEVAVRGEHFADSVTEWIYLWVRAEIGIQKRLSRWQSWEGPQAACQLGHDSTERDGPVPFHPFPPPPRPRPRPQCLFIDRQSDQSS